MQHDGLEGPLTGPEQLAVGSSGVASSGRAMRLSWQFFIILTIQFLDDNYGTDLRCPCYSQIVDKDMGIHSPGFCLPNLRESYFSYWCTAISMLASADVKVNCYHNVISCIRSKLKTAVSVKFCKSIVVPKMLLQCNHLEYILVDSNIKVSQ